MTADVELLPLPSVLLNWPHPTNHAAIRDYARACVAHATAAKDAEIEALRGQLMAALGDAMQAQAELKDWRGAAEVNADRAERLGEALHRLEEACDDSDGAQYGTLGTAFVRGICKDALRDHDQEGKDG